MCQHTQPKIPQGAKCINISKPKIILGVKCVNTPKLYTTYANYAHEEDDEEEQLFQGALQKENVALIINQTYTLQAIVEVI